MKYIRKPDSKFFLRLFFFLSIALLVSFIIGLAINYIFRIYWLSELFLYWIRLIGVIVFDFVVFFYSFRYHQKMNLFLKVFFLIGLVLSTPPNYKYALLRQNGTLAAGSLFQHSLYLGSLSLPPYNVPSYLYETAMLLVLMIFDNFAFMTGVPFLFLLIVFPSFLALPLFWLWVVFCIFYVVTPYSVLQKIGSGIKKIFKREELKS